MAIESKISALIEAYQRLSRANRSFIEHGCSTDAFRNLVEQRDLVKEDLSILTQQLVAAMAKRFPDHPFTCSSMAEAVRTLSVLTPELEDSCNRLRSALKELLDSDHEVEKTISTLKEEIKVELGRIRQGSKGLKGYRQVESLGSCFINKIK
ncbi:MAG: hypothetical protein KKB51_01225 [Candidatus Riflebacteria bacterium]|nr:hypothetical protein [Candidatus Riflebacteria bacterium]